MTQDSEHQHGFESYPKYRSMLCGMTGIDKPFLVLRQPVVAFSMLRVWTSIDDGGTTGCSPFVYAR